jgi:hypothetical protein
MVPLLLALQKIAKPGDGLHPDLLRALENSERALFNRPATESLDAVRPDGPTIVSAHRVLDQVGDKSNVTFLRINNAMLGEHPATDFSQGKRLLRLAQNIERD